MSAWVFQDSKQKKKHGDLAQWSLGWLHEGQRRSRVIGTRVMAEAAKEVFDKAEQSSRLSVDVPMLFDEKKQLNHRICRTDAAGYTGKDCFARTGVYALSTAVPIGGCRMIRVGFSRNPVRRILEQEAYFPCECVVMAIAPGTLDDETRLHGLLAPYRVKLSWYRGNSFATKILKQFFGSDFKKNGIEDYAKHAARVLGMTPLSFFSTSDE